jgi:hypothetical protein
MRRNAGAFANFELKFVTVLILAIVGTIGWMTAKGVVWWKQALVVLGIAVGLHLLAFALIYWFSPWKDK